MKPKLLPRHTWLFDRINDCLKAINDDIIIKDYKQFVEHSKLLAQELLYAVTEWEKCYNDKLD